MVLLVKPAELVSEPVIKGLPVIMCSDGCVSVLINDFAQEGVFLSSSLTLSDRD